MVEDVHKIMDRLTVSVEEARILMCVRMTMTERQYVIIKKFHLRYKKLPSFSHAGTKQSLIIIEIVERQFKRITEPQLISAFPFLILIIRLI